MSSNRMVKSSERTLLLFEMFAAEQRPLTVKEIAQHMCMPQSSTSVLVRSLMDLSYLDYEPAQRTYYPTYRIALLGTWMQRRHERTGRVPDLACRVAVETGETVILAIKNGMFAQYVLVQLGPDPLRLHVESGMRRPLACCACGWALLSLEENNDIDKIVRRTEAEALKPRWRETAAQALRHVIHFRKHGFVTSNGQTTCGAGATAILLPEAATETPMSVAVGGPVERIAANNQLILESLQRMTAELKGISVEKLIKESGGRA